ncbi:hypothetical protein VTK56DRAFT_7684 [Thermocarpiscus australiensis]
MFLALNPSRARSQAERDEMDARYKKGDRVMPRLEFLERTEEQRRLDEEERRLIEEVRQISLREATEAAVGGRRSREASRAREARERGRDSDGGRRRRRAHSAALRADDPYADDRRRRRSESTRRPSGEQQASEARARQVGHQASLRNLISSDGMDSRDIEREIEEFARQIQEEGLLDGVDLDNLDLENNDELSRKITEAYRRRHRERSTREGGRRSNASSQSQRSDVSATQRSRTEETARPTSRHTIHSRAPSASSYEERGRYPPSSSLHLEVQEPSRRRRTLSGGRSATVPVAPTQSDARVGSRAQTEPSARSGTAESRSRRPSIGSDARASSSPTIVTAAAGRGDTSAGRGLPFSARAAAGLGGTQQSEVASDSASSRKMSERPAGLDIVQSPNLDSASEPLSAGLASPPLSSPRHGQLPLYKEPLINCNTCSKEHIEYELHFNCAICHNGEWNICLDCWRRRKGCLHWFGFGAAAWSRWEKHNLAGPPIPPPHMLTANRYLPPKTTPGGAEGRRTLTTENPLDRLQSGTFCCRCSAWANDCYWRCDVCNEGEWGFCNDCVNQGRSCSHPLLPLAYRRPSSSSSPRQPISPDAQQSPTPPAGPLPANSIRPATAAGPLPRPPPTSTISSTTTTPPLPPTIITPANAAPIGNFHPLSVTPPCEICRAPIPQSAPHHYHCYTCPSNLFPPAPAPDPPAPGTYNLCAACYAGLVADGTVAAENGPAGWRRCPRGHRMAVVGFVPDPDESSQSQRGGGHVRRRRKVLREVVGGRRARFEAFEGGAGGGTEVQVCSWTVDTGTEGSGRRRRRLERLVARDVGVSAAGLLPPGGGTNGRFTEDEFPPDGGSGARAVAGWGWIPAAGVEDELMFPKGAEILEVEDVNGEWFHGFYMGSQGLFPAPYVKRVGR